MNNKIYIEEQDGLISRLCISGDKYLMNWMEGKNPLGYVTAPENLTVSVSYSLGCDGLLLCVCLKNNNSYDLFLQKGSVGVCVPFNDSYTHANICMTNRCHAHICTAGSSSWIMGLRMGGEAPHLGMYLCEGELACYSIIRENKSNDRGDFYLHPPFVHLLPGEEYKLKMKFFVHGGREDFNRIISELDGFIRVSSEHFTYYTGESITLYAECKNSRNDTVYVTENGVPVSFSREGDTLKIKLCAESAGERTVKIKIGSSTLSVPVYVSEPFEKILAARCAFIADKQQYLDTRSALDGAYLIYDNEENTPVYDYTRRNLNSSRERICMPILLVKYLQAYGNSLTKAEYGRYRKSIERFISFFKREIYDVHSGTVSNDIGHENSRLRLYNYPWPVRFFLELYRLDGKREYLDDAVCIMREYYRLGGKNFYAFTVPIVMMCDSLERAGETDTRDEMLGLYRAHSEVMIENSKNYPAHEVSYEQSIVAPAAEFMLQMYKVTGEYRYIEEAKKQLAVAELFNGEQPDFHLYECAIRHWDGFWFGKSALYGDTFPHYWSVLSANAFADYAELAGDKSYMRRAENGFRGQMCMFMPDGRASCAMLYPFCVNGKRGHFYDAYANDQDWALVYYIDYIEQKEKDS